MCENELQLCLVLGICCCTMTLWMTSSGAMALCLSTVEGTISAVWLGWIHPSWVRRSNLKDFGHRFGFLSCSGILRHATGRMHWVGGRTGRLRWAAHRLLSSFAISASFSGRLWGSPGFCFDGTQSYQLQMRWTVMATV